MQLFQYMGNSRHETGLPPLDQLVDVCDDVTQRYRQHVEMMVWSPPFC